MDQNSLRRAFRSEQLRTNDLNSVAPSLAVIPGRAAINGSGEAYIDVTFSVKFVTLPYFSFGFELQDVKSIYHTTGEIPTANTPISGQLPTGSAHISQWKTIERLPYGLYYTGAKIGVIIDGPSIAKMIINYTFTGKTLSNPSI